MAQDKATQYAVYQRLLKSNKHPILQQLSKKVKTNAKPNTFKVYFYLFLCKLFGLSFGLKLMHKDPSINKIQEERAIYTGAIVLGLNDALVELTGALAGLTLALQQTKVIAITGFITGCAAALSMAASEYLSAKEEISQNKKKKPLKSARYTGLTYLITVFFLITPYFLFSNVYVALAIMLCTSIFIIYLYTLYVSTIHNLNKGKKFLEMATISLTIALISFGIGFLLKKFNSI